MVLKFNIFIVGFMLTLSLSHIFNSIKTYLIQFNFLKYSFRYDFISSNLIIKLLWCLFKQSTNLGFGLLWLFLNDQHSIYYKLGSTIETTQTYCGNTISRQSYKIDLNSARNNTALCSLYQGNSLHFVFRNMFEFYFFF